MDDKELVKFAKDGDIFPLNVPLPMESGENEVFFVGWKAKWNGKNLGNFLLVKAEESNNKIFEALRINMEEAREECLGD